MPTPQHGGGAQPGVEEAGHRRREVLGITVDEVAEARVVARFIREVDAELVDRFGVEELGVLRLYRLELGEHRVVLEIGDLRRVLVVVFL